MAVTDTERQQILKGNGDLPRHVAIIPDGNGRWAKDHTFTRLVGHRHGVEAVREVVRACGEMGIEALSFYFFSKENWNRPRREVIGLMALLRETLLKETDELNTNNVRLAASGRTSELPDNARVQLEEAIDATSGNTGLVLNLAINYSGRAELTDAIASMMRAGCAPEDITEDLVSQHLYTSGLPDPDVLIRTSGEIRISNFLLWQIAYTELVFLDVYWPDFKREHLYGAIDEFQHRQRRFGKTGDQLFRDSEKDAAVEL
jgi:undecaprenyl diphosphate synthase